MLIKKINIEKFRGFNNIEFELGENITVIAGQNGTQKTTILGLFLLLTKLILFLLKNHFAEEIINRLSLKNLNYQRLLTDRKHILGRYILTILKTLNLQ